MSNMMCGKNKQIYRNALNTAKKPFMNLLDTL